ncbi:hypothetical protein SAMN03080598_02728 [Algoriphagus boritolerans DSM 17298 = JCM 18970]|uniref:Uncharacterized protein n=1 Tax=Algoriphagus boritolerans DSM 17298 = JCM 18970 TaxID=1120964 RepID=A0A1H5Y015_9BACT|nr:hypothetical protein SAMN03080598_02728 [Algoriphagus boritolerans DSM 17298 = JCM 18970]
MTDLTNQIFGITRLHREIDALVYKLYGLTEEIRIVEGNG